MTKTNIFALTALCLLAACAKDDATENGESGQQEPISFSNSELAPQPNIRAVGLEDKGVHDFYVWGYKTKDYDYNESTHEYEYSNLQTIMEQYRVAWNENSAGTSSSNIADWEYVGITDPNQPGKTQNIKYWDMEATSYRFFGIAPCSTTGITYDYNHTDPQQATEYEIKFNTDASHPDAAPYISALWITNNNILDFPTRRYKDVITMEFMKPVTKVRIELIDEHGQLIPDPSSQGISKMEFAPTNGSAIIQKGQLTVSYPMQGNITFTQYLPKLEVVGDLDGAVKMDRLGAFGTPTDYSAWYYVLPHIEQDAFQLSMKIGDNSQMATVPAKLMSWNPNVEYTYKFKLTSNDVQFIDIVQIGVTEWRTFNVNYSIHNW